MSKLLPDGSAFAYAGTDGYADGQCRVEQSDPNRRDSVTFTVDSLEHDSLAYESSDNHDPEGDSDGTSIVMLH